MDVNCASRLFREISREEISALFQAALGEDVEIRLFKPVDKCREFSGRLDGFDADSVTILEGETSRTFQRGDIAVIRLAVDF